VAHFAGVGLCLVLDVNTSYVGRRTLADYVAHGRQAEGVEREGEFSRWVNDYGNIMQSVYLLRLEDRRIGEVLLADGSSVFDYLTKKYPALRGSITPKDQAATFIYRPQDVRDESRHYTGSTRLLRPKFTTESAPVRRVGDKPAFPPSERWRRVSETTQYFKGARISGTRLEIGPPVQLPGNILPLPKLAFGSGGKPVILSADGADRQAREEWGSRKLATLLETGPARQVPFTNPFVVYPASLEDEGLLDGLLKGTADACHRYGRVPFEPQLSSYREDAHPADIIAKVQGIMDKQQAGFILLALPASGSDAATVYRGVKSQIRVPTKCFSTAKFRTKARKPGASSSYIEANALAMLVENGTRPWDLVDPLNFEMQFGFDVARTASAGILGGTVVAGRAQGIIFAYEEIPSREQIPAKIIGPFVLHYLEQHWNAHGRSPGRILFQRDGRFFDSELRGISNAVRKFEASHPNSGNITWSAVAIQKNPSVPLRLFRHGDSGAERSYGGSYCLQSDQVGYIVLAGAPSLRQGTPRPLRVELVAGNGDVPHNLLATLQDIFCLSQLNWNTPAIDISLPITLRFTDQKLERYALEIDDRDDDQGWEDGDESGS
jgi:hypothetical protein